MKKPGDLLRFGIPDFKLSKAIIDRRIDLMIKEGLTLKTGTQIGRDISASELVNNFDAVCIAIGSGQPRDLSVEGTELEGNIFCHGFSEQSEPGKFRSYP